MSESKRITEARCVRGQGLVAPQSSRTGLPVLLSWSLQSYLCASTCMYVCWCACLCTYLFESFHAHTADCSLDASRFNVMLCVVRGIRYVVECLAGVVWKFYIVCQVVPSGKTVIMSAVCRRVSPCGGVVLCTQHHHHQHSAALWV